MKSIICYPFAEQSAIGNWFPPTHFCSGVSSQHTAKRRAANPSTGPFEGPFSSRVLQLERGCRGS